MKGSSNMDELQEKMRATCLVRRLKKDVLKELPPKRRMLIPLPLNGAADVVREEVEAFEQHEAKLTHLAEEAEIALASGDEAAYKAAAAALKRGFTVAFSDRARARHAVAQAKVPKVVDHIKSVLETEEKVVVFAHHTDVIEELQNELADYGPVTYVGDTPLDIRQETVDAFQTRKDIRVFIGSIGAAGVGITLTAAATVIFCELPETPGETCQAEDRCHRIGQQDNVLVQHLVFDGSLDARIVEMLIQKQAILDAGLDLPFERALPVPVLPKPRTYPHATPQQKSAALAALKRLAGCCDGARSEDEMGFNRMDTTIGRSLASVSTMTDGQFWLAKRILPKYHRQVGWEVLEAMGFERKK
jgi:SWI/SNF-related matrix-associated actin-dependent regulator 1 of chromatin subfamily A